MTPRLGPTTARAVTRDEDQRARRLACTCFERPLVVEAGAGTGKTATLVARVLTWILGPGFDREARRRRAAGAPSSDADIAAGTLGRVVSITFTEAAAAEMADRVAEGLRGVASGAPPIGLPPDLLPPDAAERASALLSNLDSLEVRTIHSFCARLLQEHALAAGLHPAFTVDADGDVLRELIEESLRDALIRGYGPEPDEDLMALGEAGVGPQAIVDALQALCNASVRAEELPEDPLDDADFLAEVERFRADLVVIRDELAPLAEGKGRTNLRDLYSGLDEALRDVEGDRAARGPASVEWAVRLAQDLHAKHGSAWKKLGGGALTRTEQKLLGEPRALLAAGARVVPLLAYLAELEPAGMRRAIRVLAAILADVERRRHRRGVLTFSDLLERAARLLETCPDVRARLREGIDQLLVDEFQDTDPLQCRIVAHIALEGDAEARPGLFLVGDPKQSIYGWRRADLAAYEDFVQQVVAAGGERVSLVVNFRSVPAVLTAVQDALQPVMRPRPGIQPSFQPLLPCPRLVDAVGFSAAGRQPVEIWSCWRWEDGEPVRRQVKRPVREIEADAVARDIARVHAAGVAWSDIAVLFRASTDLPLLVDALRRVGVPYAVQRDRSYFQRREITDAVNLVSVVAAPHDQVALVGWLRSAMVGVPDAALLPLWRMGLPGQLARLTGPEDPRLEEITAMFRRAATEVSAISPPIPGLPRIAGWEEAAIRAVLGLARMRRSLREDACDRFVQCLRDLSLIELGEAARYLGVFRQANLDRFFRGLRDGLAEGGDLQRVLRTLREGLAGAREDEEGRPQEAAEDAVQLMTIHKSKGLGFGHVYVVGLDKTPGRQGAGRKDEAIDGRTWRLLGHASPAMLQAAERAERTAQAERVRLLYVAMTRAKQRLVMSGLWSTRPDGRPDPATARSLVDLLGAWPAVPGDLAAVARDLPDDVERTRSDGALLVFPGRLPPPEPGSTTVADPSGVRLPSIARARRDALRIAALRDQARQRQRRPWTAVVSADAHARLAEEETSPPARSPADGRPAGGASPGAFGEPEVPPALAQEVAMAAGSAVHRALELLELGAADPDEALDRQIEALEQHVAAFADEPVASLARDRAAALLDGLRGGTIIRRLHALAGTVIARELPVLLPARTEDAPASGAPAPVAGYVGAVDLLLWDPQEGQLVVVDYKTDDVAGGDLLQRAASYRSQARAYATAVEQALAAARPPRAELWFLRSDRIIEV